MSAVLPRVLIADDEPHIVASLEFLMRECRYEVKVARDGEEALQLAGAFRPDLVLLDVMMPRSNGFELCRRLRAHPQLGGLKIVMLSAKGREADVRKGLGSGADAYITKPFSTRELVGTVRQLLQAVG